MLVEYSEKPTSIDIPQPRFSWIVSSAGRDKKQTAFRIIVASDQHLLNSDKPDLWDSGRIESGETIHHKYLPANLRSDCRYFWRVFIWDGDGNIQESPVSEFSTAFLPGYNWQAAWIGNMPAEPFPVNGFYKSVDEQAACDTVSHDGCSLLLRHEEELSGEIESASAFITGLGYYEFYINGKRVGEHRLSPAKTPYHKYVLYDKYNVTTLLRNGRNAFGIHLGNGWYNPYKKWWNEYRMQWFGSKRAKAEIHIKFKNGREQIIGTNEDWLWSHGPVIYNCVYDGEAYDANLEQGGWNEPGFNDSSWKHVAVYDKYAPRMVSSRMPAITTMERFNPREIKVSARRMKVYDMGQNFAGWVHIEAKGTAKTSIRIRFAEDIKPDSTIDITSNENAKACAYYIMKGSQPEIYEPSFTYFGFRYVEITSTGGLPEIISIQGRAVYSDNEASGLFECSDELVNKIHRATVWSQKSNMTGYPSDCPQRDERLGWMGDAQVTTEEAMFNFNMALFYENWLTGIRENQNYRTGDIPIISPRPYIFDQGVEWSSTYIIMLWQYYLFYGDKKILTEHYLAMKQYMHFLDSLSKNLILPKGWIGDWGSLAEGWKEGDPASVPTAYYFWDAKIMSSVSGLLGMENDMEYFKDLSQRIKERYNRTYLDTITANYNDGSQMANCFPLWLGIVPEKFKARVFGNLVKDIEITHNNHLTTGVIGTKFLPEVLADEGRPDIAWKIINQTTSPCWNDMMKRYNTMCEFWSLRQSKNHVMMGSIDSWFYKYIAGIRLDEKHPAFESFQIRPFLPENLGHAKAQIKTIMGIIASEWEVKSGELTLKIEVPFKTTATVYIPGKINAELLESKDPVKGNISIEYLGFKEGHHIVKVPSGKYLFSTRKD